MEKAKRLLKVVMKMLTEMKAKGDSDDTYKVSSVPHRNFDDRMSFNMLAAVKIKTLFRRGIDETFIKSFHEHQYFEIQFNVEQYIYATSFPCGARAL